ncbi:MAG: aminotransferase class V-fold PLP-dependent enzyme [Planctomycetota bacterium]
MVPLPNPAAAEPVYLDHNATTPVDPRVFDAMRPFFLERFGNASSRTHAYGHAAADAVEAARSEVARLIAADPREIVFTSGATESNNLALKGAARAHREQGDRLITAATEHKAVLDPCRALEREGFSVTVLPVGPDGRLEAAAVERAITDRTILVSVMAANNEVGVLGPLSEVGRITKAKGVLFHSDAAQAVGKEPLDVDALGVDLLSISAHKMHGPKGVGALYVRRKNPRVRLEPLFDGGGQEGGLRPGTLDVPGIVGLGKACELSRLEGDAERSRVRRLRERLRERIFSRLDGVRLNGHPTLRLAGNLNLSFEGVDGQALLVALKPVAAISTGSACTTGSIEPSHVLRALGVPEPLVHSTIRFGLGRFTTEGDIDRVADAVVAEVSRLRARSPFRRS